MTERPAAGRPAPSARRGGRILALRLRAGGELASQTAVRAAGGGENDPGEGAQGFPCEFHVAADVRRHYGFPEALFRSSGNAVFADFRAVREFAARMNERRPPGAPPVRAGDLNAMGLIDEILHYVFRLYESTANPGVLARAIGALGDRVGRVPFDAAQRAFTDRFPPVAVFQGRERAAEWLGGSTAGRAHAEVSLEEVLMAHLANLNPAFGPYRELFDERPLASATAYPEVVSGFRAFLRGEKPFGGGGGSIIDFLEAPMRAHPDSLAGQLGYIRDRWGVMLSEEFRRKILSSEDLAREDAKHYPTGGPGAVEPPDYRLLAKSRPEEYPETENFTHDTDWMPNVVLIAKNTYVWLHQLSRTYGRAVSRLDEVPDAELDRLASWNISSLWLIGVWHRSPASEKIKRMTGNPEAAPSAYSLHGYEIAPDLGGEEAFSNLADRAWRKGIRLAADMVPNHTGITSRWVRDHPDYFIQADRPPFPVYRFTGPDLSDDPEFQVRIEDGYWTRSDAAVVFQHIDSRTGRLRYIYHGNDGTNMPWNDTAQLDFLKADVREAVIGQILHVARKFSVIRFDAAMTLTKKHFHRLWYPHPGTGGDIPSRSDYGLMQEEFDRLFPAEFWREVVDRINREMPNTLLLAEAFWLLEGYFVRTLGMHRVYNSAFMHMLMKEDNAMYRGAIRSTLHFNPEILKRYVNFMSNPDERTAIDQFGDGDKYFGVATLMVTLPGLPMFAHGQVEGFREKYGMEYRRDYHDEDVSERLVRRHEREIFPLLAHRRLFSQTEHFELFDVRDEYGNVLEDVFAYSNMADGMRAVVCYNNRYEGCAGTMKHSAGKLSGGAVRYTTLADALRLGRGKGVFHVFREQRSGLEYVRTGDEFRDGGLFVRLRGFESQVFLDFREVDDPDGAWRTLHDELGGAGVRDADRAARAVRSRPLHAALAGLLGPGLPEATPAELRRRTGAVLDAAGRSGGDADNRASVDEVVRAAAAVKELFAATPAPVTAPFTREEAAAALAGILVVGTLFGRDRRPGSPVPAPVFDELLLGEALRIAEGPQAEDEALPADALARLMSCFLLSEPPFPSAEFFGAPTVRECLDLNTHEGTVYFRKESLEAIVRLGTLLEALRGRRSAGPPAAGGGHPGPGSADAAAWEPLLARAASVAEALESGAAGSGYRLEPFLRYLQSADFLTLTRGPLQAPTQGT